MAHRLSSGQGANPLPPRLPPHRRPQPDPRSVPERVAILLTGHKSRTIFDRYNIIHEQELLEAGDQLGAYLAQQAQAASRARWPDIARLCAAAHAQATRTGRAAIVAHAATGRADAADHAHAPGLAAGAGGRLRCQIATRQGARIRGPSFYADEGDAA